jgi:hypothetical protein
MRSISGQRVWHEHRLERENTSFPTIAAGDLIAAVYFIQPVTQVRRQVKTDDTA